LVPAIIMYVGSMCSLCLGQQWCGNLQKKAVVLGSHETVVYVTL